MRPQKAKDLIPKVAELTEFPQKTCETLITFFYKQVREKLSTLEEPCLQIEKIGNFYLKEKKADKRIRTLLGMRAHIIEWTDGIRKANMLREIDDQLQRLEKIENKIQLRKDKRALVIQKQHDVRAGKICLEKQAEDNTGILE